MNRQWICTQLFLSIFIYYHWIVWHNAIWANQWNFPRCSDRKPIIEFIVFDISTITLCHFIYIFTNKSVHLMRIRKNPTRSEEQIANIIFFKFSPLKSSLQRKYKYETLVFDRIVFAECWFESDFDVAFALMCRSTRIWYFQLNCHIFILCLFRQYLHQYSIQIRCRIKVYTTITFSSQFVMQLRSRNSRWNVSTLIQFICVYILQKSFAMEIFHLLRNWRNCKWNTQKNAKLGVVCCE